MLSGPLIAGTFAAISLHDLIQAYDDIGTGYNFTQERFLRLLWDMASRGVINIKIDQSDTNISKTMIYFDMVDANNGQDNTIWTEISKVRKMAEQVQICLNSLQKHPNYGRYIKVMLTGSH